ncbi:MAG: corrinoid protein [Clostridia bacterium]|nr:corrinoid protein [Clostridia bacterium]
MSILLEISEALQKGNAKAVSEKTKEALNQGLEPYAVLTEGLIAGMGIIGVKFKNDEIYVPEVMMAAKAMYSGLDILKPRLAEEGVKPIGKVVLGTVKGDLHDIGKNLVGMMMIGAGLEVIDLGKNVSAEKFVNAVVEHKPAIVALSALLTTTMPEQKNVIEALKEAGLRESVKVMIGGAPVTETYANEIGADAYTPDAASAAQKAKEFIAS